MGNELLEVDEDFKNAIRRKVHGFFIKKEIPTLDKVLLEIRENQDLPDLKKRKLWNILHNLNLRWEKHNGKSVLVDKTEIIYWRREYLQAIRKFRAEERNIFVFR